MIVILYTEILRRLHRKSKIKKSKLKTKSNRKITKMVLTIIVCYLMCWSPYWISQIFNYFYQEIFNYENTISLILVSHFVQIIAYLSSALNPFIYSYTSEAFKNNLKLTFSNCFCCQDNNKENIENEQNFKKIFNNSFGRNKKLSEGI